MNRHSFGQFLLASLLFLSAVAAVTYLPLFSREVEHDRLENRAHAVASGLIEQYGSELFSGNSRSKEAIYNSISILDERVSVAVVDESENVMLVASTLFITSDRPLFSKSFATIESDSTLAVTIPSEDQFVVLGISRSASLKAQTFWDLVSFGAGAILFILALNSFVTGTRSRREARNHAAQVKDLIRKSEKQLQMNEEKHRDEMHQLKSRSLKPSNRPGSWNDRPAGQTPAKTDIENTKLGSDEQLEETKRSAEYADRHEYDQRPENDAGIPDELRNNPALAFYSKRLEVLNHVAVMTLKSVNQEVIVSAALDHLAELISFDFARVVEYDIWKGEGRSLGSFMDADLERLDYTHMPITYFRGSDNVDRFQRYIPDLENMASSAELDQDFLGAGLRSYFRQTLQIGDDVIGVLTVASRQKDAFSMDDMKITRDVVDLISLAVSQGRLDSERDRYEAELISAKDRAEEMARVKTSFLSNMSHEVRTPLSGIIGFAQVMRSELTGEMGEFATLIYEGGTRLLETINSVLDFAKLESGQLSMVANPTDVNQAITAAVKLLAPLAAKKNLPVTLKLLDEPLYCTLDQMSLNRILNNLIGNAIKFTEEGYVEISTELTEEFGRIVVSDTGPGISEEFMPDLFNEFYQEEMGVDRKHEGSGLGLAITRRLVDQMGGWIEVDNREVRGTMFAITFPISSMEDSGIGDGKVNSVLIVSDTESLSYADYAALQHNMDLQTVPDVKSAVQHARHRRFDMVVVKMDDKDSDVEMERIRAVREIPEYDKVPFIALSEESFSTQEQQMLAREFDGFSDSNEGLAGYLFRLQEQNKGPVAATTVEEEPGYPDADHFPVWEDEP